jgi:glc operon protein GlcG
MKQLKQLVAFLLPLLTTSIVYAEFPSKRVLTLEAAEKVAAAAEAEAKKRNATVVIAVVDDGGYPVLVKRLNDTQVASVDVGIGKARTAAIFRRPSKVFEDQVRDGRVAAIALPGSTPLQGGLPILYQGQVIGAIGVSGSTPKEDEEIAMAGVGAISSFEKPMAAAVTYFPAKQVSQAFVKGMPLIEIENYEVHASHRDEPGIAEIHTRDTDIIYVLEGNATFVTGGSAVDPKSIGPAEIRGKEVRGGEERRIVKGDVIVVPNGVPHWFKQVSKPFDYYVVKVRSEN